MSYNHRNPFPRRLNELAKENLSGYILKKDSPSCGMVSRFYFYGRYPVPFLQNVVHFFGSITPIKEPIVNPSAEATNPSWKS